ncbi:hypothetical protein M407DRAFT_241324 [Tulasnella calospora MUT 4182]|uniref:Glucosamine 6-phosphate N-acetyltransferase n=1 Tax=Tulasnella calospora MUT 4182 TaxID=1051891 RepID=A0A0C3MFV3_9AGAM|nr:hypothetical protein M407DRAFT_241324 [Tulasnella calospora MUT 4182]
MALTPDAQLELLFDPALIPESVKATVPDDLHIRPLASTDLNRSQFDVLAALTQSPKPTPEAYKSHFELLRTINASTTSLGLPPTYLTLVILSKSDDKIVATGSVVMERKFIRGLSLVGHIEDISVDKAVQGKRLGIRVVTALTEISEGLGAYKTILDCSEDNSPFYVKCGYKLKGLEMSKYKETAPIATPNL